MRPIMLRARLAGGLTILLALACAAAAERPAATAVRIGVVAPDSATGWMRGASLGADEARRAARLIGGDVEMRYRAARSPAGAVRAAEALLEEGVVAIIGGHDAASCRALAELAARRHIVFVNVGCRDAALRDSTFATTIHIAADEQAEGVLWHGGLERFGAAQLNERFARRFGAPADAAGWAGWLAVKVLWETALRAGSTAPDSVLAYLRAPDTEFDGHKGRPLRFEPRTGQLRQPLYVAQGSGVVEARVAAGVRATPAAAAATALARLPRGTELLIVSNEGSGTVTIIDAAPGAPVATIAVGSRPRGIHAGPDGSRVYVALSDDAPTNTAAGDAIAVLDLRSAVMMARYPAGSDPEQFALSPDGGTLYAANEDAGTLTITDLRSGQRLATLIVGIEPEGVAVSPDGRWVYVTAETSNTVSVIDAARREVVASFLVDVRPRGVTFAPDGDRAFVTNEISGTVSVIDVSRHAVTGGVELESAKPVGVAVSPDGARVYVANGHGNSVAVLDARSGALIATIPVGRRPWGLAVSADGRRVYTANGLSNDVSIIDAERLRVIGAIPAGERPWGLTAVVLR